MAARTTLNDVDQLIRSAAVAPLNTETVHEVLGEQRAAREQRELGGSSAGSRCREGDVCHVMNELAARVKG